MVIYMTRTLRRGLTQKLLLATVTALLIISGLGLMDISPVGKVNAATLSFALDSEEVNVTILRDASVDIDYHFKFSSVTFLDGVDIGLPNSYYDPGSAAAYIIVNGVRYSPDLIHASPYVNPGMAVEIGSLQNTIQDHGSAFDLFFHINNPHMVYLNDQVPDTVGVSFRPTWFDTSYQIGNTGVLTERLFFPIGFSNASQAVWLEGHPWDSLD